MTLRRAQHGSAVSGQSKDGRTCACRLRGVAAQLFLAVCLTLPAAAQSTNIAVTRTNQPITFIQPEGRSVIVSQRIGVTWKIWFAQGPLRLGTNYVSQACCVRVTNAAVREVRVTTL